MAVKKEDDWWAKWKERRDLEDEIAELREVVRANARVRDRLWFDDAGKLWFTHDCLGTMVDQQLVGWWISREGGVRPSIRCRNCGAHAEAQIHMSLHYIESGFKPWVPVRDYSPRKKARKRVSNRRTKGADTAGDGDVRVERDPGGARNGKG